MNERRDLQLPLTAMDSTTAASMQGKKNPICARARDDPRILSLRMLDVRQQALKKLSHKQLFEEGRRSAGKPKAKAKAGETPASYCYLCDTTLFKLCLPRMPQESIQLPPQRAQTENKKNNLAMRNLDISPWPPAA